LVWILFDAQPDMRPTGAGLFNPLFGRQDKAVQTGRTAAD